MSNQFGDPSEESRKEYEERLLIGSYGETRKEDFEYFIRMVEHLCFMWKFKICADIEDGKSCLKFICKETGKVYKTIWWNWGKEEQTKNDC